MINIADGYSLWSQKYDCEMKDFFAIQDEIALAVVDNLKLTLLGDEKARLVKHQAIDPAAYEEYLKGLHYWWQWSDDGMQNAILHFGRAIEIAPEYAQAHAGMALAYLAGSTFQIWPPREGVPKGKDFAQKAIQLDPTFAEGYAVRALARMNFDWDWEDAEKDLTKALELNPNSILALDHHTNLLAVQGRFDEAVTNHKKALELDPLSHGLNHDLGWVYWMAGQLDRAIPCFRKALDLDRNFYISRLLLAFSYKLNGSFALASLNHPNIATIYGLEQADGKRFLAMELVEGETLAQRIAKGVLPVEEALEVCRQIAEGVDAAHEKGVIHRDLKPANIKMTPDGKVKILDFGLAKAFQEESAEGDLSHSPTITEAMTRVGVILGTAAYMSPEQAKGRPIDNAQTSGRLAACCVNV